MARSGQEHRDAEQHDGQRSPAIGPTVAAVLISTIGISWCFTVDAVSFMFVIASLLGLDAGGLHPIPPVPPARGQLREGLRYAAPRPGDCPRLSPMWGLPNGSLHVRADRHARGAVQPMSPGG